MVLWGGLSQKIANNEMLQKLFKKGKRAAKSAPGLGFVLLFAIFILLHLAILLILGLLIFSSYLGFF